MKYSSNWDLESIPDQALFSEAGRRYAAMRKNAGGFREGSGRKPELALCPRCRQLVTKTQARRGHSCVKPSGTPEALEQVRNRDIE